MIEPALGCHCEESEPNVFFLRLVALCRDRRRFSETGSASETSRRADFEICAGAADAEADRGERRERRQVLAPQTSQDTERNFSGLEWEASRSDCFGS